MREQRAEARRYEDLTGYFQADGSVVEVKVRDRGGSGVGVYTAHQFRPGQQGLLLVKSPDAETVKEMASEIRWCGVDPEAVDRRFPYRAGLRLLKG